MDKQQITSGNANISSHSIHVGDNGVGIKDEITSLETQLYRLRDLNQTKGKLKERLYNLLVKLDGEQHPPKDATALEKKGIEDTLLAKFEDEIESLIKKCESVDEYLNKLEKII